MPNYYLHRNGQNHGPYSHYQLKQMLKDCEVDQSDLICLDGESEWMAASTLLINNDHTKRRNFLRSIGLVSAGLVGGFISGRISNNSSKERVKLDGPAIYEKCKNSIVVINIHAENSFGTGFCIDRFTFNKELTSFIATADHVTGGNDIVRYRHSPEDATITSYSNKIGPIGKFYSRDSITDAAIFTSSLDLEPLSLARDYPAIGETIYTIGHPRGDKFTLSSGIVSGYNTNRYPHIQITAPISPGSSGGPVLNQWGEVVGVITSYKNNSQNLNQAILLSEFLALSSRLQAYEKKL